MKHKNILTILITLTTLWACGGKQEDVVDEALLARQDSAALHVAVYPCQSCLPFYYAEAKGLFKSLDTDIRLIHLSTMEDCDTALTFHRAEVSATDLARLLCMRKDGYRCTAIATMNNPLSMITAKGKRITSVKQLKERLVAMDRHSFTDYLSDKMLEGTGLEKLDIFRTQFNIHKLRCDMLNNALVDAAFLDEPFAQYALEMGGKQIWKNDSTQQTWNVLAIPTTLVNDPTRTAQMEALFKAYDQAVEAINKQEDSAIIDSLLKYTFELPHAAVDTIPALKEFHVSPLSPIKEETTSMAKEWLVGRGWIKQSLNTDSLYINKLFSK